MNKKRITVTIDTNGKIKLDALGYKGTSCKDATKALEKALGSAESVKRKAEWSIKEAEPEKVRNSNGGR